jgi:hypothetical protein
MVLMCAFLDSQGLILPWSAMPLLMLVGYPLTSAMGKYSPTSPEAVL